jgi:hypothetical protein
MMVYLSSDKELPIIPYKKDFVNFYVNKLGEQDFGYEGARKVLSKKYLYNAGAHTGCGCGFDYGTYEPIDNDDIEEEQKGKESVSQLFNYIKSALITNKNIELYACIAGNEGKDFVTKSIDIIHKYALGDSFFFVGNELWKIKS